MTATANPPPAAGTTPLLRLFGSPALRPGGHELPLQADRAHGLLAYLACRRDWVRRDELADQLYPGRDLDAARSNLRKVIFLARKVQGVGEFAQRGDLLRWAPDSDLARFEAACDQRRHGDAVALYGGPLLLGLDAAWPPAARDWLDAERQRLQSRWHEACNRRLADLAGEPAALLALAETMLRHDPLDDAALQALARARQALGQARQALSSVSDFARRLDTELQLQPSAALRQLADQLTDELSAGPAAPGRAAASAAAAAPAAVLVGRRHELAQARQRLGEPSCRALTLLGPPGVGKSALARRVAAEHGAAWVALDGVSAPDEVAALMAAALGLMPEGRLAPWPGLAQALGARPALLVLDNADALPLARPLATLLDACPGLRLIATAQSPLGLVGEWRLPLDGLPLPDADERDPEVLRANDAVSLFEQRARPLAPGFDLGAEAADVVRLVHEVEGLPLAIELLAAWRRVMPVRDIVEELAASLDLLEPSAPGERSVRAAFERGWCQLGPAEQRALARLACLPAPVEREMVRQVAQAPLPVLAALIDRSLLRADDAGRFWMHPLIRRCAAPLADDVPALHERHARHAALTLGRPGAALGEGLAHALAAWDWGVAHAEPAVLGGLAHELGTHLIRQGRARDGLPRAAAAERALRPQVDAPHHAANRAAGPVAVLADSGTRREVARTLGTVLVMRSNLCYAAGELDDALAVGREARRIATTWGFSGIGYAGCRAEGSVHWQRGDYDAAEAIFSRCLAIAREDADVERERAALMWLGLVAKAQGRLADALTAYTTALHALRAEGRLADHLYLPNNMGNLLRLLGRHDEALALLHEALALGRTTGSLADEPFLLVNIALAHETAGRLLDAARFAAQALASAQQHGEPMIEAAARLARARVSARHERDRGALHDVHAALAIERRLLSPPLRVQCLATAGVVLAACGDAGVGVALVRWAMQQAEFAASEREDAARHLAALGLDQAPCPPLPSAQTAEQWAAQLPLV